ncbi:hypothetical protein MLD38_038889 [Melastoma candidum]|uniref:Uncharacterized protein n=1 Tax=Melastoma candidum TaxID=119954 RepID=A0ACB9L0B9_9MYRT|nr:hypothetical protein MLD38_038889 [Melastoma candidum]
MERLPDNLLKYEILMRLPMKMVARFRVVSKRYYSSITSDSYFVAEHCESRWTAVADHQLLIDSNPPRSMHCNTLRQRNLCFPEDADAKDVQIKGSCHGMLCLLISSRTLILWNPATMEYKRHAVPLAECGGNCSQIFGLGYDPSSHDYKLLVIDAPLYDEKTQLYHMPDKYSVYSWRHNLVQINSIPQELHFFPCDCNAVYLNHHLHWYGKMPEDQSEGSPVLSYHMGSGTFSYLPVPTPNNLKRIQGSCVHRGRLCLLCLTKSFSFQLWMMEEYGVGSSWRRQYNWGAW